MTEPAVWLMLPLALMIRPPNAPAFRACAMLRPELLVSPSTRKPEVEN